MALLVWQKAMGSAQGRKVEEQAVFGLTVAQSAQIGGNAA